MRQRGGYSADRGGTGRLGDREMLGVLAPEGLVDVDQHLLLPLAEALVGEDRRDQLRVALAGLEDAGPDVELLGGDPQPLGDLLQDVRARLAQPALDLREVRVGNAGEPGELTQRDLGLLALLPDEFSDRGTGSLGLLFRPFCYHLSSVAPEVLAIASSQLATLVTLEFGGKTTVSRTETSAGCPATPRACCGRTLIHLRPSNA